MSDQNNNNNKRVAIIGAGAAGMACAFSLAKAQDPKIAAEITVFEESSSFGGVAITKMTTLGDSDVRQIPLNIGVQGGAISYRNIINLHDYCGAAKRSDAPLHVSFGVGEKQNWTNQNDGPLLQSMRTETARFGKVLKWIHRLEPATVFLPIDPLLKLLGFSDHFRHRMVIPLVALFFGTGNRTSNVSASLIARVFHDSKLRLFDYDPHRLLAQQPKMFSFSPLEDIYNKIADKIRQLGREVNLKHRLFTNCKVVEVQRNNNNNNKVKITWVDQQQNQEGLFDEIVFACGAETTLKLFKKNNNNHSNNDAPTFAENFVLSGVSYYDDITLTHTDEAYMSKHYEMKHKGAMYFIKSYESEPWNVEMSFELNAYQKHIPQDKRIFQSIFLDAKQQQGKLWTDNEISEDKIIAKTWWHQFAHDWQHYARVVPFVPFIQNSGNKRCWHCGSWTVANTHEIATISGFAVAYRLGAPHPFPQDEFAADQFNTYLCVAHGLYWDVFFANSVKNRIILLVVVFVSLVSMFRFWF